MDVVDIAEVGVFCCAVITIMNIELMIRLVSIAALDNQRYINGVFLTEGAGMFVTH